MTLQIYTLIPQIFGKFEELYYLFPLKIIAMNDSGLFEELLPLRTYFQSGVTRSHDWRKEQLLLLKKAILQHEDEIHQALYTDLKKSPEEAYGTETGLVLAEINNILR